MNEVKESEIKESAPVTFSVKPRLRPDGEFVCLTLTQGDIEIQLTPEQARSLVMLMKIHLPDKA